MDWQKELERTLNNVGASSSDTTSLYDGQVSSGQHLGSSLSSLMQRQGTDRSPWAGYRNAHQWSQMAWMSQHRAAQQVWGDPSFRQFFADPSSQDIQSGSQNISGFRSPWEPTHDVKTIENVLNSVSDHPVNYRTRDQIPDMTSFRQQAAEMMSSYGTGSSKTPPQDSSPSTQTSETYKKDDSPTHSHTDEFKQQEQETFADAQHKQSPESQYHDESPATNKTDQSTDHSKPDITQGQEQMRQSGNFQEDTECSENPTNLALKDQKQVVEHEGNTLQGESSPEQPKDLTCDKAEMEEDTSSQNEPPKDTEYDIIKNMTEKFGNKQIENEEVFESRKSHLETVLSKMNKSEEQMDVQEKKEEDGDYFEDDEAQEKEPEEETEEKSQNEKDDVYDFDPEPKLEPDYKPIKLKIAKGEIVENTAIEEHSETHIEQKEEKEFKINKSVLKSPSWALAKSSILKLQEKLETDEGMKEKVKEIVGEDVLNIFASSVEEAESAPEDIIDNKNVVFLYYAIKNSTNLDNEDLIKDEMDPLSNLALSVPLLDSLWKFLIKDHNIKEQIQSKIGQEDLEFFEKATKNSAQAGDEFLQDEVITPKMVKMYHSVRNLLLTETFSRLTSLYSKTEHILNSIDDTEDHVYNSAVARLRTLVTSPWNQQVKYIYTRHSKIFISDLFHWLCTFITTSNLKYF